LVDWGFKGWTCKLVVQEQEDRAIAVVAAEYFHQRPDKEIYAACAEDREAYGAWEVYADASHPFQNQNLRDDGFAVEEVAFSQYKDLGVGWIRGLTERGQLGLPGEVKDGKYEYPAPAFRRLHQELKGWRRGRTGQIVKRDDHGPDALLCGAAKWAEAVPWSAEFVSAGRRVSADVDY